MPNQDRYLKKSANKTIWQYRRKIPLDLKELDSRAPQVVKTTGKSSVYEAREIRNIFEKADNEYWDALRAGLDARTAREKYDAAVTMKNITLSKWMPEEITFGDLLRDPELRREAEKALSSPYIKVLGEHPLTPLSEIGIENLTEDKFKEFKRNQSAISQQQQKAIDVIKTGMIGTPAPAINLKEAAEIFIERFDRARWENKSPGQLKQYKKPIHRAVRNFDKIVSTDKGFMNIDRQDAKKFWRWLDTRVADREISPSTASRIMGNVRTIWQAHADHEGLETLNPFRVLNWAKRPAKRPSLPESILNDFLIDRRLLNLNSEARRALIVSLETGARPSEIINIKPENIFLDHPYPHIFIKAMENMAIKTRNSERKIPLVGAAFEAMKKQPLAFPRYYDKGDNFSATINKFLKIHKSTNSANKKMENTDQKIHTLYSLRHSYEDRMKRGKFDLEMRYQIAGHAKDRADYGEGYTLEDLTKSMNSIALEYDPKLI